MWVLAGVGRSVGTLPLSVPAALLPPREQACENLSSIALISFGMGHCWKPEIINFYHPRIECVGTVVILSRIAYYISAPISHDYAHWVESGNRIPATDIVADK